MGRTDASSTSQKSGAVGLHLKRLEGHVGTQMMPQADGRFIVPCGTAKSRNTGLPHFFRMEENVLIHFILLRRTERRFQIAGNFQRPVCVFLIFQGQVVQKRSVQRIDEQTQSGFDLEKFVGKDGLRRFKSNAFGNRRNTQIPEGAALTIPQVQPGPGGQGAVLVKTGQHPSISGQIPAALRIDEPGGASAAQHVSVDGKAERTALPRGNGGNFRRRSRFTPQGTANRSTKSAGLFLQEQPVSLYAGQVAEQPRNILVAQHVAQRSEDHPLMAAHVAADDLGSMLFFGKIGCFKEAHGAFHAHVLQPKQVLKATPQIQRQGQNRRIGRNNVVRRVGTLRQRRKAEGLVLIIKLRVKGMTAAFADPVNAARPVRLLLPQGGFQSGGQQRARNWRLKQQGRHVLGQGTVTGE